ncbi:MAG: hypothetical protein K2O45_17110 [Oscillospiraceae bacterium]|nr:hypothetical protein [Oscillospiraceae bacterium]
MRKNLLRFFLLMLAAGILTACAPAGGDAPRPEPKEGVLTYAALNPLNNEQKRAINIFNRTHEDVQIEVLDYSDEGGVDRLLTELTLGWVPDIMDLHHFGKNGEDRPYLYVGHYVGRNRKPEGAYWLPYRQMVQKGYLADLWPYIENDPKLGREAVLEAPLKAAEVDGGLYMLFKDVYINTLAGSESVVGGRDGWTMDELMETFSTLPEGATIMRWNTTREEMYDTLYGSTLDQYIDWEAGRCSFDCEEFRDMLKFLATFPAEFKTTLTPDEAEEELAWRRLEGRQLLEAVVIDSLKSIVRTGTTFGEKRVAYVGYPTADGSSGSVFHIPGTVLAMSSACPNKDAAWEFMGYLVRQTYSREQIDGMRFWSDDPIRIALPVNRQNFEIGNTADIKRDTRLYYSMEAFPGGPLIETLPPTEEDIQPFEALINNTKQIYWPNEALSDTVWDAIGPYFAGDKTLDETIQLVQNRVTLYVNENR